jgi:hypothetical protein
MTTALEGGEGSAPRPDRFIPPGKSRYPFYRRKGGPQGRFGQVRKIFPTPGFDPRTVQPIASRYTDYANRPTLVYRRENKYYILLRAVGVSMRKYSDVKMWSPLTKISFDVAALKLGNARVTSGIRRFLIVFFFFKDVV